MAQEKIDRRKKLTIDQVITILNSPLSSRKIAKEFNTTYQNILEIRRRHTWKNIDSLNHHSISRKENL